MSSIGFFKAAQFVALNATTNTEEMSGRIFGLDWQLIADFCIQILAIFFLFVLLSYLLFNPARNLMQARQKKIKDEMDFTAKEKKDASELKHEYTQKLKSADKEVEGILGDARKRALKQETVIVDEAKEEASRIIDQAHKEAELEKNKVKDEVKQQIIDVAGVMASKIIAESIDPKKQAQLIDETLSEMGDDTWQK